MEAFYLYLNQLFNTNRKTFDGLPAINWLSTYNAANFDKQRQELLEDSGGNWLFKNTKPFHNQISKGCNICGEGKWSCLFITGRCNANCFYCPASQKQDAVPSSQQLTFDTPEAYAEYIRLFNFNGVSFSGGEPLLFFERTMDYLKTVRKLTPPETYIWLYTNGILANKSRMMQLAGAGLDEIRFDIGASKYSLDKIACARGNIKNITVEIPAVPEDTDKIKKLLPQMIKSGITNLNLHQLRLTKHNAPHLLKRKYTYYPSERPVVIESELAALNIINYAHKHDLEIGINYCSFDFKNRFQKAGYRRQISELFRSGNEHITENGYLRDYRNNKLSYRRTDIGENPAGHNEFRLNNKSYMIKKSLVFPEITIQGNLKNELEKLLSSEPDHIPENELMFKIWQLEYIESNLRNYL